MAACMNASSSSLGFLPLEGATSPVWKYFGFKAVDGQYVVRKKKDRKEVHCKICKKVSLPVCSVHVLTVMLLNLGVEVLWQHNKSTKSFG